MGINRNLFFKAKPPPVQHKTRLPSVNTSYPDGKTTPNIQHLHATLQTELTHFLKTQEKNPVIQQQMESYESKT